jgi:hypothetical protein
MVDNFILVDKHGDKYRISMQDVDIENYFSGDEKEFNTFAEAVDDAHAWEAREVVVNYGISIDPRCFEAYEETEYLMDCGV